MAGAERNGLSRPALWYRIRGAQLPIERDGREFFEHLAEITGLPAGPARALELEYRRFLYLAVLSTAPRMPSGLVRVAWSYHAEHEGYGADFCPWVLGRSLRFTPTANASQAAYGATVAAYEAEFGAPPPPAFWPDAAAHATLPMRHGHAAAPLHA